MTLHDKAKDLRSSGYALTICGGAGLLAMLLVIGGLIPISLAGIFGIITKIVMSFLFAVFLIMGILSFKRAKLVFADAEREREKKKDIKSWFIKTYDAKAIDDILNSDSEGNDLYYERIDLIKDKICERFMDVEDALMSELTEEIYTELFEEQQ